MLNNFRNVPKLHHGMEADMPMRKPEPKQNQSTADKAVADDPAKKSTIGAVSSSLRKESPSIAVDHENQAIACVLSKETLATTDPGFVTGFISDLLQSNPSDSGINELALNFLLSVVNSTKPKDQLEVMLAAQMAVVHRSAMKVGTHLACAQHTFQEGAVRALVNLTRTFAAQMDALTH